VEISEEVVSLLKRTKTTTIMVTHDREDALVSADVIALMRFGSVVQSGSPAEVYSNPISADVAESTGDIVTIPAQKSADGSLHSPIHDVNFSGSPTGELLIRPEEILVSTAPLENGVTARISRINYYGHDALIELSLKGLDKPVRARVAGPINYVVGQEVFAAAQGPLRWVSGKATRE
jgi:iron(III) transport system ATP-binding protein